MWWVCILHHFVVGLYMYYIILWWVCNISLCGEVVFHHLMLHHCSGLVLNHFVVSLWYLPKSLCGEFVLHHFVLHHCDGFVLHHFVVICNTSLCGEWQLSVVVFLYHLFCGVFISSTLWWFFFLWYIPFWWDFIISPCYL